MTESRLVVISGGPGAGKTRLLNELARRGLASSPEIARQIIQEQVRAGGTALPWDDRDQYSRLMLAGSISRWKEHAGRGTTAFFDRGIPDTLCYVRLCSLSAELEEDSMQACRDYRYWHKVFLAPPWREIYETDSERKQNFNEAVRTFDLMTRTYSDCGYEVVPIPLADVGARADFVLEHLAKG